ncbi:MAG: glutamate racemase [Eubacterium sp.]|nr:glutamate racemase [Eubacterium sp.]
MEIEKLKKLPIGFMDSGLGGLSVLREALKVMPAEDYIYYGDSAHAPYGTKSQEEIRKLTFDVVEKLLAMGIKGLAVACNTATSAAVKSLRAAYPDLPIVGIEPAIKPAWSHNGGGSILVMATPMTIAQEKYHILVDKYRADVEIISIPCEGLMEFVEAGELSGNHLTEYFESHLGPFLGHAETIVLGCTHYPFLKPQLAAYLDKKVSDRKIALIDGGRGTARELRRRLERKNLLKEEGGRGKVQILNSSDDPEKIALSERLLALPDLPDTFDE